jgi:hypothetical protein
MLAPARWGPISFVPRRPIRTATRARRCLPPRSRRTARRSISRPAPTIAADWWRLSSQRSWTRWSSRPSPTIPTLQAAEASLRQSQDNLRAGYGVFFPQGQAGVGAAGSAPRPRSKARRRPARFSICSLERHHQLRARRVRRQAPHGGRPAGPGRLPALREQGGLPDAVRQCRQHQHRARGLRGADSRDRAADRTGEAATSSSPRCRSAPAPLPIRPC